jgi:ubiquinone/menaquinone biosynthesis C-methylase UbiE
VPTPPRCRPDASFDLLCNAYLLDLIPFAQVRLILGEFHRVLAPGVGWCCST